MIQYWIANGDEKFNNTIYLQMYKYNIKIIPDTKLYYGKN